jgi:hypothetical protein
MQTSVIAWIPGSRARSQIGRNSPSSGKPITCERILLRVNWSFIDKLKIPLVKRLIEGVDSLGSSHREM